MGDVGQAVTDTVTWGVHNDVLALTTFTLCCTDAEYPSKSNPDSPTCSSPTASSFRHSGQRSTGAGIQGNTVTPPSLSAPTSARALSQGDACYRNSSHGGLTAQQQQQLLAAAGGKEGSRAAPLEYGSPPQVSRSGSWTTLASGSTATSSFHRDSPLVGTAAGTSSVLPRPPSVIAAAPPGSSNGGSPSSSMAGSLIEADPQRRAKLADYYHARGYAARKQGDFKGAIGEYSRALSLSPTHFKALFNRGFSFDKVCHQTQSS